MKKTTAVAIAGAVLLGAALTLVLPAAALADKTITLLSAGSSVTSMSFDLTTPGQVNADVCGQAPLQGGGTSKPSCYHISLTSGAVFTAVNNLAAGAALTFWQSKEGV